MSIEDEIEVLRQKLPWVYSNPPHILEAHENDSISIVAADRPDKAVVIGPGGFIAGNLAKAHGKSLSITAYTDTLIRTFRKEESRWLIRHLKVEGDQRKIVEALEGLLTNEKPHQQSIPVGVALSGGRDSLATAVLLRSLFSVQGFTVSPSDIILPQHVRKSIDENVRTLDIPHEYVSADFSAILEKSLTGRIHPCGPCHRTTSSVLIGECKKRGIPAIAFGELLPTGSQSLRVEKDILVINLPAFLALTKRDTTLLASEVQKFSSYNLGCPLLKAVHQKYPHQKYATAKRIFREVRAGVLEPGEALEYLKSMLP